MALIVATLVAPFASGDHNTSDLVAASVLRTAGFDDVSDVVGGFGAWQNAGLPSSRSDEGDSIGEAPHVGARTAQTMLDRGALLLDVREPCARSDVRSDGSRAGAPK